MEDTNLIFYVCRVGYEIKTWIHATEKDSSASIIKKGRDKFKELGVDLNKEESYDWEWY